MFEDPFIFPIAKSSSYIILSNEQADNKKLELIIKINVDAINFLYCTSH